MESGNTEQSALDKQEIKHRTDDKNSRLIL